MSVSRILVLRNSISGAASFSNKGVDKAISAVRASSPNVSVVERDLVDNPVPMLTKETFESIRLGKVETANHKESIRLSDELITEIKSADMMIVGLPRYNFGTPASFKTYLDYIARPRVTFAYSEKGPQGLLPNIPVWAMMSTGGPYADDYYPEWIRTSLPFVGLSDITFFPIGGVGMQQGDASIAALDGAFEKAIGKLKK